MGEVNEGTLGDRIRAAADRKQLSQVDLADAVGASPAAISQWIAGRKRPTRTNIQKLADTLGVLPEWLEYGVNEPAAADYDTERADHLAKTEWHFRPQPKDGGRDFGNANIWSFNPTVESIARETAQNIKDAGIAARTQAIFRLIQLKGAELDDFRRSLKSAGLLKHLAASARGKQKLAQFIRDGMKDLEGKELLLLRVEDRGGVGLTGEEFPPPDASGHFTALCKNNLDSEKDPLRAAGAFGLGKAVLWRASRLATVLFHSNLSAPVNDGRKDNRVFGRAELPWHEVEGAGFAGPGWFGMYDEEHESAVSVWGNRALASDLYMEREDAQPGTTILVLGFQDPAGDEDQPKVLAQQLEASLAKNFWPAIVANKLSFKVEIAEGRDVKASTEVDPTVLQAHFVAALQSFRAEETVERLAGVGDVAVRKVALTVPKRRAPEEPHPELKHEAIVIVRQAAEDDETAGQVVFYRGAEMIVVSERWKGLRVGAKPFHAIVLCGEAAGSDAAAAAAERFLRTAEPPAHNTWTATQELKVAYVRGGKARLEEFIQGVRAAVADVVAPDAKDLSDGPRALKELLRIGESVEASTDRPRVTAQRAHVDESGRWVVEATVRVKPDSIIDGRPVVVFQAETGGGQQVKWDTLEAMAGCAAKDGRLFANKGARELRFRGSTDPQSHPVPASSSTIVVDFRDAHLAAKAVKS